ncbi:MAG: SAM-dependent methyltransferase [Sulfurospirillum sp.]|nr:SAM-dependent methyltransferase [Sulfurospirillum sp.]
MREWLYGANGYYRFHNTIGKEGDFYTAVSSSMFFGGAIAKRAMHSIEEFLSPNCAIVEIGAHKGYLLADMVQFIYTLKPELLDTLQFYIVEPFVANQEVQKNYFKERFGDAVELLHVSHISELTCKRAFVLANEIFDAFACEVIKDDQMLYMDGHTPIFKQQDPQTKALCEQHGIKVGELAQGYEAFAKSMADAFEQFEFVTFDYGDKQAREDFSLRVYEKHQVFPFFGLTDFVTESLRSSKTLPELFGISDITYDVNFSHLISAFSANGVECEAYASQMKALVDFGIIELLEILHTQVSEKIYQEQSNRVKTLLNPAFMGERFKMCCFRKGVK